MRVSGIREGRPRLRDGHPYAAGAGARLEAARRDDALGKLRRAKKPKEPKHWLVTCGGCAHKLRFQADQRYEAVDYFRSLDWRDRSVPGVRLRRWFCPGCQNDQDWSMMFAFASPVLDHLDQEELKSRALKGWSAGNPRFHSTGTEATSSPPEATEAVEGTGNLQIGISMEGHIGPNK